MRLAIFENIMTPGGHEVDFDRIIVEEFQKLGHEVCFYVPEGFRFAFDYHVPVRTLKGEVVTYSDVSGLKRLWRTIQREKRRMSWYKQLYRAAQNKEFDALIVPTSTYRYLRALKSSILKNSPVPIIFILHGINPGEAPKFLKEAKALEPYHNVRPTVLTFGDSIFGEKRPNIRTIYPPTYTPRDLQDKVHKPIPKPDEPLVIGFFGQYRREKRLEDFLEVYEQGHYTRPVKLLVQGATMHPEDAEDFERIIAKYKGHKGMEFLHKGLIGREWQEAIAGIDALLMPYSAPRYRYHWGGMLFTAIGFEKPVVASDDMNPEVFEAFHIGKLFKSGDLSELKTTLEEFINTYDKEAPKYEAELKKASAEYSPEMFAKRLEMIFQEK